MSAVLMLCTAYSCGGEKTSGGSESFASSSDIASESYGPSSSSQNSDSDADSASSPGIFRRAYPCVRSLVRIQGSGVYGSGRGTAGLRLRRIRYEGDPRARTQLRGVEGDERGFVYGRRRTGTGMFALSRNGNGKNRKAGTRLCGRDLYPLSGGESRQDLHRRSVKADAVYGIGGEDGGRSTRRRESILPGRKKRRFSCSKIGNSKAALSNGT